jgi:hypothetical protein
MRSAQLIGGPEDGNLVSSDADRIPCHATYRLGLNDQPGYWDSVQEVRGYYVWDRDDRVWRWELSR